MKIKTLLISLFIAVTSTMSVQAAKITLTDEREFIGEILHHNQQALVINVNGIEMTLPPELIKSIDFSVKPTTPEPVKIEPTEIAKKEKTVIMPAEVPAGTVLRIKMDQSINSREHKQGHRFTAKLEANLMVDGVVIAPRDSVVYGVMDQVKSGGRIAGSAEMSLILTDILINDEMVAISTVSLSGKGANAAADTLGRTARTAAIGGLINGSDGAKTGAKVGVGASLLTRNNDIQIAKDTLLDFSLKTPIKINSSAA
ncbi:hypothetical protein GCM10007916_08640 [Psychromonas marina]|uniref:Uncharacterized protein n=1 Tax=Psychromonas marina TaxID=88364 RepID=A0ABQ6DXD3_9GAMM|nr:hypothetical protein [Psychromonas marina]GLS89797.1 hypothetical protein GCM10007916_08640 [Psychromonas marina]